MNAEERMHCRQMALELGVSEKSLRRSGALRPEITEAARATLINHIKRGVKTPHNEPMLMPGGLLVRESTETITLTIRKQPTKADRGAAAEVLAVQRAGGRA